MKYYFSRNSFYFLPSVKLYYMFRRRRVMHLELQASWLFVTLYFPFINWKVRF